VRAGWSYLGEVVAEPMFSQRDWEQLVAEHAPPRVLLVAIDDTDGGGRLNRGVLGGLGGLEYVVAFNELAAFEAGPGADERDEVGRVDGAPAFLGGLDQLECHGDPGGLGAGPLGDLAVPDRGESQLDGVGSSMNAVA
jgi:hypothetical protein